MQQRAIETAGPDRAPRRLPTAVLGVALGVTFQLMPLGVALGVTLRLAPPGGVEAAGAVEAADAVPGGGAGSHGIVPAVASTAQAAALERLAWLEGEWTRATRGGTAIESWHRVEGFGLVGGQVVVPADGGDEVATEALLLAEMGGGVFYFAYPRQNPYPVAFRLVSHEGDVAVFENAAHDFPQRIVYRRDGPDAMTVTISDIPEDGEPNEIEFAFERR